jgi:uncharacterized protein YecE (DUF72 family)
VPEDFRYCPKVPQTLSHARDLGAGSAALREFCERMEQLAPRMGMCFLQLPPYFEPRQMGLLERLLDFWPDSVPLAVEVRHPLFFEAGTVRERWFDLLRQRAITAVITEVSGRRDVCHMELTTSTVMVRFVGNSGHPTDAQRLQNWGHRLQQWCRSGVDTVYFFTHQPDNILAPELAAKTEGVLRAALPEAIMRGPREVPAPPVQGSLF